MTLSLELTPPTVAVTSPSAETVVSGASVTVTATVRDALSRVVGAACNGAAASVTPTTEDEMAVSCTVPVRPGTNAVVVQAVDQAGNTASGASGSG